MLTVDRIRFHLGRIRLEPEGPGRDRATVLLMADAMIEERRNTGAATTDALTQRYGFTAEEIARASRPALDEATRRFVDEDMVDPVAVAA